MENERLNEIRRKLQLVDSVEEALNLMAVTPDQPADLSEISLGAIKILKKLGVNIMVSGDLVFGIIHVYED